MSLTRTSTSSSTFFGTWWWTIDRYLLSALLLIMVLGMVLVMAASPAVAERIGLNSFHFVSRQICFLLLGLVLMFSFSVMTPVAIRRVAVLGLLSCMLLMILVLIFGEEVKGAKRWLPLGGFTLQPSEFLKPFFAVVSAWILARKEYEGNFPGFKIAIGLYGIAAALLLMQPDFGMTIAVSTIWGTQMFMAGLPMLWVMALTLLGIAGAFGAYMFFPHVANRINIFLDPASGDNYQVAKSLEAFANGGLLGRGPGQGVVKSIIPDSHTDFIFAVAGEELGIIACLGIVVIFAFVVLRGFIKILQENDLFIMLATTGLLVQFGMQAVVNMGVALNLLPNKGMTLPFISYGGSSTLAIAVGMGMVLAFTRKRYGR